MGLWNSVAEEEWPEIEVGEEGGLGLGVVGLSDGSGSVL
jgi:hypothetical protein